MDKPTFAEWMVESKQVLCDVYVKCTDGTEQFICDCVFNYGSTGNELVSKKGYQIEDYFFVKSVDSVSNFRRV